MASTNCQHHSHNCSMDHTSDYPTPMIRQSSARKDIPRRSHRRRRSSNPLLSQYRNSPTSGSPFPVFLRKRSKSRKRIQEKLRRSRTFCLVPVVHDPQFGVDFAQLDTAFIEHYTSEIPTILLTMRNCLVKNGGFQKPDIFRISVNRSELENVKEQLNSGTFMNCKDVHCIANLLKIWFRELKSPLLSGVDIELLMRVTDEKNYAEVVFSLEEPQRSILLWLLDLCVDVARYTKKNHMTPHTLSILFAPNLHGSVSSETEESKENEELSWVKHNTLIVDFLEKLIVWRKKSVVHKRSVFDALRARKRSEIE